MPRLKLPGSLPSQISHPLPRHTRAPTCICSLCRISYKRIPVTSSLNCSVPCCPTSQKDLPPQLRRPDAIPATHSSTGQRSRGKSSYRYAVVDAGAEMVSLGPLGYQGNRDAFCQKQTPGLLPVSVTQCYRPCPACLATGIQPQHHISWASLMHKSNPGLFVHERTV